VPFRYQTTLRFQFDTHAMQFKFSLMVSLPILPFLVLPYYHRSETFYRRGYVSAIGFSLRLPQAYQKRSIAPPEWPETQANAE